MRQWLVGPLLALVALGGCSGAPEDGGACSTADDVVCRSRGEVYACMGGAWLAVACAGPRGCEQREASMSCDLSLGRVGELCPPWAEGKQACQASPAALLTCSGGRWKDNGACASCTTTGGAPQCLQADAGVEACGPATCTGCCRDGACVEAPANGDGATCGAGGVTCDDCGARGQQCDAASFTCVPTVVCNATTCPSGCCSNGQCVAAPLNTRDTTCGGGGFACADCAALGLACNPLNYTCRTPGTGGGAGGGGGATGGGTGGGGSGDPCQGVPVAGQCLSTSVVRFCSVPTGNGTPSVQTYQCPGGYVCQTAGAGASCVQTGVCRQDDTRCTGASTIQVCNASGAWGPNQSCAGRCVGSVVGANCGPSVATVNLSGTLRYETRAPRADLTDWDAPTAVPARNVLVIAQRDTGWVATTTTNAQGQFTLAVPATAASNDTLVFAAYGGDGLGFRYAVADPNLGAGTFAAGSVGQNARFWSWSRPLSQVANGGTITITTAQGSGALNLFDMQQFVWATAQAHNQGKPGLPNIMWLGLGTEWECGACFVDSPAAGFDSQIWMPGGATDQGYWSDYTTAHELGHWQMASYGTSPNEGGTHLLGCRTMPGMAWSEGYATWHSAALRNTSFLEDKQGGGFFWFNLASRTYFPDSTGPFPFPTTSALGCTTADCAAGLIDENLVAAMLWTLTSTRTSATREIFQAVAGQHLNTGNWPRGYTRHTWDVGQNCALSNVTDTGESSPQVADAFDALRCAGQPTGSTALSASALNNATRNGADFPYPAASPLCRSGLCYGCKTGSTCVAGNTTAACGSGGMACVQCSAGQSCTNGVCQ